MQVSQSQTCMATDETRGAEEPRRPRRPHAVLGPLEVAKSPVNAGFSLSETGTFSKGGFAITRAGIKASPLGPREVSHMRYADLTVLRTLGAGASAVVKVARHGPTGKLVALKVRSRARARGGAKGGRRARAPTARAGRRARAPRGRPGARSPASPHASGSGYAAQILNMMADAATREQAVNELRVLHACSSPHLVSFFDAFYADGSLMIALALARCSLADVFSGAARASARMRRRRRQAARSKAQRAPPSPPRPAPLFLLLPPHATPDWRARRFARRAWLARGRTLARSRSHARQARRRVGRRGEAHAVRAERIARGRVRGRSGSGSGPGSESGRYGRRRG